ncbi:uncharacterized protein LOC121508882 isoform X2 [Cheilinus undulatus]|uniref:uncharacterized protein LOC121508882 isoform X2 n=1 Tax=Cheilinus undulatus TaxID=241271 RepID=UPI001BD4A622|nr:uncharacterized protein LOC121508882 isoform X2 [Cheilinus undulatus]
MAFANLFSSLSDIRKDLESPAQPVPGHRNDTGHCKRGRRRKRGAQGGQTGPDEKKPYYQTQTSRTYGAASFRDDNHHMSFKGQNNSNINNPILNKQNKKRDRGRQRKNGQHRKNDWQDSQAKQKRFMSQEFKDQNALFLDGRLLCKHFLYGRCIKGDNCQLEHVQGYNNLVKEVCKFYIQGACIKGESCPYMHKSFPCKFFHTRGKCSQGEDCRFSHEPLSDLTQRLLDEVLKQEQEQNERAKKAEQESLKQTEESENKDMNELPDILLQPLRPKFYQSVETEAENNSLLPPTEETPENIEGNLKPHVPDDVQPPSSHLGQKEPVCYSVEAVLGPQLSKRFLSFTSANSQKSAPLYSSESTSNQSLAPYSVEAVLRSVKSAEASTPSFGQTFSYTPKTGSKESTDSLLSTETQNKQVCSSVNARNEGCKLQETLFNSLPSFQTLTSPYSKACSDFILTSKDHKTPVQSMQEPLKPVHEVKFELLHSQKSLVTNDKGDIKESMHLPTDIQLSGTCASVFQVVPKKLKSVSSSSSDQTSFENPAQLKPNLSTLMSNSKTSFKPFCPSSGFIKFQDKDAVPTQLVTTAIKPSDSSGLVSHCLEAKQPIESDLPSQKNTLDCSSTETDRGTLATESKKISKISFHNLFASPITDSLQPQDESITASSCPNSSIQASSSAPKSATLKNNPPVAAAVKAPERSFASLFAPPPLGVSALLITQCQPHYSKTSSCPQQSAQAVELASHLSDSKQTTANLKIPVKCRVRTEAKEISHRPKSPHLSSEAENGNKDSFTEPKNQEINPLCSPVSDSVSEQSTCPAPCVDRKTLNHADHSVPEVSLQKEVPANSILRTLFLHLSPYQDEEQQDSVEISSSQESEINQISSGTFEKQHWESKTAQKQRKLKTLQTTEKQEQQPSHQTPHILQTDMVTNSSPRVTKPRMRNSRAHGSTTTTLMQHHSGQILTPTSEHRQCVNRNMEATPLKNLFKTLDSLL